ncbi:phosphopentomutase/phosphoglucosamine mutase [Halosimplex amylolyticum]|uniref:phosphopentomutase/phosphoglucosamine mutase n=1 Tax=Halosimplex amylolyticum TaxID=3396616 RepID=UPI003F554E5C
MDLFGTAGIRGDAQSRVTPELALAVGRAVGDDGDSFVVGRDGRTTGEGLAAAVEAGLLSAGADVTRIGQVPTPTVAYAAQHRRGVMLTASHNPPADNGIKLFADGQEYDDAGEARVERRVDEGSSPVAWDEWGETVRADVLGAYRDAVAEYAREYGEPLDGLSVAVDCGNGVASLATPQVLRALGADVTAINANVDGHFPGRESKPTAESLRDLRSYVAEGGAELGFGHDGDGDRIVVVDASGEVVHEDTVVAILAEHYVAESEAGDPVVVTTPNASARIDERVRGAGGRVERVRLGALHEGIAEVRESGTDDTAVVFAAEPWKHIHTALGGWIDGVASAAVLARLVAGPGLAVLRDPVNERPYRKVSVDCPDDRKDAAMDLVTERLPGEFPDASVDTEYGVRLELPDGSWTLVRPSGTEPYVRVYAESEDVSALVETVTGVVRGAVDDA